jgi:hypothetical protein
LCCVDVNFLDGGSSPYKRHVSKFPSPTHASSSGPSSYCLSTWASCNSFQLFLYFPLCHFDFCFNFVPLSSNV